MGYTHSLEVKQLRQYSIDKRQVKLARDLWERGTSLNETPAQQYLVSTRKIPWETVQELQIKSLKGPIGIAEFDHNKPYNDYVMLPVKNLDDAVIGVQIIQIDAEGNKASSTVNPHYYCKKYVGATKPLREGKAVVLNDTQNVNTVFIAEGIETAASIASLDPVRKNYTVLASMGVNALGSTLAYLKTHFPPGATVVLLKDHDASHSPAEADFNRARVEYELAGYRVLVKEPLTLDDDWNDVLVRGGVTELAREFGLDELSLSSVETAEVNSNVAHYFKDIYKQLLKSERSAEDKTILLLLDKVIEHMLVELNHLKSSNIQQTMPAFKKMGRVIDLVQTVFTEYGDQLVIKPRQLRKFERMIAELERLEIIRRAALETDQDIDLSVDPRLNSNGDLFKAYSFAMHHCHEHLKTLTEIDIQQLKKSSSTVKYHEKRIREIDNNLNSCTKMMRQFIHKDRLLASQLQEQLAHLKTERKFHSAQLIHLKQQLRLIPGHFQSGKDQFTQYYRQFIDDINSLLAKGKTAPNIIRRKIAGINSIRHHELQKEYQHQIDLVMQRCFLERKVVIPQIGRYLMQLRNMVHHTHQKIHEQGSLPEYREFQDRYLHAMSVLNESESDILLQHWLNSLVTFKMISPLIYAPPGKSELVGEVTLLESDSDEEVTLNSLCTGVYCSPEDLDNAHEEELGINDEPESDEKLDASCSASSAGCTATALIAYLQPWKDTKLDHQLILTIQDFAERLAVNVHKSFEVISPSRERQEFDGLALRDGQLTIIERKTNDGTGPGLLQRNFCQQKIVSKQLFLLKDNLREILSHVAPQDFIEFKIPNRLPWYSTSFSETMEQGLISAAKLKIIEALKAVNFEFIVNCPQSYSSQNYNGLFFNRSLIQSVSLRFSESGKGNEDIANEEMDSVSRQRTEAREQTVHFMELTL